MSAIIEDHGHNIVVGGCTWKENSTIEV